MNTKIEAFSKPVQFSDIPLGHAFAVDLPGGMTNLLQDAVLIKSISTGMVGAVIISIPAGNKVFSAGWVIEKWNDRSEFYLLEQVGQATFRRI